MSPQQHPNLYNIYFLARRSDVLEFKGGKLVPVDEFKERLADIRQSTHEVDGFLYPPISRTWRTRLEATDAGFRETGPRPVRGSRRQALLFRLKPSHTLWIDCRTRSSGYGHGDEAFLMHALAFLYGTRLQLSEWFVDMRLPVEKDTRDFFTTSEAESAFISTAYATWQSWEPETQDRVVNALYMNSRSPSYEWDWERFTVDYMVFDALYRTAHEAYGLRSASHRDRLRGMCERFDIPADALWLDTIYRLRNELYHESLWAGCQPGSAAREETFRAALNLRYLNMRLLAALLGYRGEYLRSEFWGLGISLF